MQEPHFVIRHRTAEIELQGADAVFVTTNAGAFEWLPAVHRPAFSFDFSNSTISARNRAALCSAIASISRHHTRLHSRQNFSVIKTPWPQVFGDEAIVIPTSLVDKRFVGQALPGNPVNEAVEALHRVALHVALIQAERKLVNIAANGCGAAVHNIIFAYLAIFLLTVVCLFGNKDGRRTPRTTRGDESDGTGGHNRSGAAGESRQALFRRS
jgi:hypothetical protein